MRVIAGLPATLGPPHSKLRQGLDGRWDPSLDALVLSQVGNQEQTGEFVKTEVIVE